MSDGSIRIKTKIDTDSAETGLAKLSTSLKKFAGVLGLAFGISAIVNFTKTAVSEAGKVQSALIGLQSILDGQGRSFSSAQSFINEYIEDGLVPLNNAVTAYKNLALRGYSDDQIKKTMIALKDASSFARQSTLTMGEAVQSASEGLKNENSILVDNAGVTKNVAKMWDEYAKSIGKSVGELTQQEKIQAEVNGILEETKFQTGDAAKYAESYEGSVSKFNATLLTFKQNLGALMQGVFKVIINGATKVISTLNNVVNLIGAIIQAFTGKNPLSQVEGSSGEIADNYSSVADSLSDGEKSAKAIKKSLAGFDEMNILAEDSSSSSSGGSSSSDSTDSNEFNLDTGDISGIDFEKKAEKIKEIIEDIMPLIKGAVAGMTSFLLMKGASKAIESLNKIWKGIKNIGSGEPYKNTKLGIALIIGGIVTLYESFKKMFTSWDEMSTKEKVVTVAMAAIGAAAIALGYAIATGLSAATLGIGALIALLAAAVTAVIALIAKFVGEKDAIKDTETALNDLKTAQEEYTAANDEYVNAVDKSEAAFRALEEAQKKTGLSGKELFDQVESGTLDYANMTEAQREVYKAYLENESAQNVLTTATENLTTAKKNETDASWANQLAIAAESDNYDDYKKSVIDAYEKGEISAEQARDYIEQCMSGMSDSSQKTFMEDIPSDIQEGLNPDKYQTTGQKIGNWFGSLWEDIKYGARQLGKFFGSLFSLKEGSIGKSIVDSIANIFKKIINTLISGINSILALPFNTVNKMLNKIRNSSFLGISPFKKLWSENPLKVPQIPKLAKGGIINQPTQAIIGEAGPERVIPLSEDADWINKVADSFASKMSNNTTQPINIYLPNGKLLAQYVIDVMKKNDFVTNGGTL